MKTLEVEFTEADKNKLINEICAIAETNEQCHEKTGAEFIVDFNEELHVHAKVLINDDFYGSKPTRHVSTDIKLITVEGFYPVKSNLDYLLEDSINKALINEFHKNN